MTPKRKAAADIFKEQNVLAQAQSLEDEGGERSALPPPLLAAKSMAPAPVGRSLAQPAPKMRLPDNGLKSSEELQLEKEPVRVRETGFWIFKQVIVPPNAYVVHTRMRRKEPVTLGLGLSFRYNSYTDAYLIVPAAMQTIGVVANCISKEKQGINILAYVQWQIDDFAVAYRKLDFSDMRDPLGIVNAQLREQAEAAIKDKIATMGVEEVLTDKAPIIEELTARLKAVTEGRPEVGGKSEGLGIKIVTVQIREALVSSEKLWQDLQAPFRHQQEKTARISLLTLQEDMRQKELEARQSAETNEAQTMVEIERITQSKQTEAAELKLTEEGVRFTKEQESIRHKTQLEEQTSVTRQESEQRLQTLYAKIEQERKLAALQRSQKEALERAKLDSEAQNRQKTLQIEQALHTLAEDTRLAELELQAEQERLRREETLKQQESALNMLLQEQADALQGKILETRLAREQQETLAKLDLEEAANRVTLALREKEIALTRLQQEVRNLMNQTDLLGRLVEKLPEIAAHMPEIQELKVLQTGGGDAAFDTLAAFVTKVLALAESLGIALPGKEAKQNPSQE